MKTVPFTKATQFKIFLRLLIIFTISILLLSSSINAFAATIKRLSGENRYETSAKIALSGWTKSDYAILVLGEDYPDALSVAPLAGKYKAPILLMQQDTVPTSILDAIKQLSVKNIFVVGEASIISPSIKTQLTKLGAKVTLLAGANRYETSIKIAEQLGTVNQIVVVTGEDYADALSIAPIAVKNNMPIILVGQDYIPTEVKNYISKQSISKTYLIGKGTSITSEVGFPNITEINGEDKYARNIAIINEFKTSLDFSTIYFSTGEAFSDALSGSVLAGMKGNPLILVGSDINNEKDLVQSVAPNSNIKILGGVSAVPDDIADLVGIKIDLDSDTIVTFKNKNLEKLIRSMINKPTGDILKGDCTNITNLHSTNSSINDLSGIENLTNLTVLDLSGNKLSNLDTLKGLNKLNNLDLSGNQLSNITALSGLTSLTNLDLSSTSINDITPLKDLTNLTNLDLNGNQISNLDALTDLTKLVDLGLSGNQISKLTTLKDLTNLNSLNLSGNLFTNINSLKDLTNLTNLDLSRNSISDIDTLKGFTNLAYLNLACTSIDNIDAIKDITSLVGLGLNENKLSNIDALKGLINLTSLQLSNNQIRNIDALKNLVNLVTLDLNGNKITDYSPTSSYYKNLKNKSFKLN